MWLRLACIKQVCFNCGAERVYSVPAGTERELHKSCFVAASAASKRLQDVYLGQVLSGLDFIFDRIGGAWMDSVYRAVHLKLSRVVAMKLINTEGANESGIRLI